MIAKPNARSAPGALSLHHLSAMGLSPVELLRAAALTSCEHVCFFVYMPDSVRDRYPMVERSMVDEIMAVVAETGVTPFNLEVFPVSEDHDMDAMETALQLGAELGAKHATAHVHLQDPEAARTGLLNLSDMAARHGIHIGVEFNPFSQVRTLDQAAELIAACNHPNLGIVVDCLHFMRSSGTIDRLRTSAAHVRYAQLCDGPAVIAKEERWREALRKRAIPGRGVFPLKDIVSALDQVAVFEVEVPDPEAGHPGPALQRHVAEAVSAARAVLA